MRTMLLEMEEYSTFPQSCKKCKGKDGFFCVSVLGNQMISNVIIICNLFRPIAETRKSTSLQCL